MKMTGFHSSIGLLNDYEEEDLSVLHFIIFCKKKNTSFTLIIRTWHNFTFNKFVFVGMII